jgi:RNA polymerase sigma factor (sigma-70 family)
MTVPAATLARMLTARPPAVAPDARLLARFAAGEQAAFAEIVRRHGPMVRSVARRAVRDRHLADDVSQAVFLVLARKAAGLTRPDRLANWLFGVTRRVALRAAHRRLRDAARTRPLTDAPTAEPPTGWVEAVRVLDEELARLSEAERLPLVLCYLEGMTQDEAAGICGWSVRTLRRRLAAGRDRLRGRLERRGLGLTAVLAALASTPTAEAVVPTTTAPANGVVEELVRAELRPVGVTKAAACLVALAAAGLLAGLAAPGIPNPAAPAARAVAAPAPATAPASDQSDLPEGAVTRLGSTALRHPGYLTHLRFTPDGRQLISYGEGKVRRWDARTGAAIRPANSPGDITTTYWTTFLTADGKRVIAPHVEQEPTRVSVREYDLATGKHRELFVIPPRTGPDGKPAGIGLERFILSPDGTLLVEGYPHEAYLWDLSTGTVRQHLRFRGMNNYFAFPPDGRHLITAAANNDGDAVRLWDVSTGKEAKVLTRNGRDGVSQVVVSPDGRWLAAVESSGVVGVGTGLTLWDQTCRLPPREMIVSERTWGGTLAFSRDGEAMYAISGAWPSYFASRWDVQTGKMALRWGGPHGNSQYNHPAVAVSPNGGILAVGRYPGIIRLFDTHTDTETTPTAGHTSFVARVTFLPASGVRTVGFDGVVTDWDARTGKQRGRRDIAPAVRAVPELV